MRSLYLWPSVVDSVAVKLLTAEFRCSGYGYSGTAVELNRRAVIDECLNTAEQG